LEGEQNVVKTIDCDLHIHSRFSAATSRDMTLENIARGARQKGLSVVATGDALNKFWLEEIEELDFRAGVAEMEGCRFLLTTEVEDRDRVHHLILFRDLDSVHALREALSQHSSDLDTDGRPHIALGGGEIARLAHEARALIGPSHAFVPWTSVYKEFDSLRDCYGEESVEFLELGLSADTELANTVKELEDIPFLSNSDAHSPMPHRLGREFNRLEVEEITFEEIRKAIAGEDGRGIILNVGLDPRLGKYHRTSCISCYRHFTLDEALSAGWRCPRCGGKVKKGVLERISELNSSPGVPRPRYLRIAPLAEIIAKVKKVRSVYSAKVNMLWTRLVELFGSEIAVLVDVPVERIAEIDLETARAIKLYREQRFRISEGGGGKYGEIIFDLEGSAEPGIAARQRSLDSY